MHFLGNHDVCRFGRLRMWAERGLIHVEDETDGSYEAVSVRTILHRMQAHSDMLCNSKEAMRRTGFMDTAEYNRIQGMLETMTEVVRKAQEQGMPSDPTATGALQRALPTTVCMPGAGSFM